MPQSTPMGPRLVPVMRTMDRSPKGNYLEETLREMRGLYHPSSRWDIWPIQLVDSGMGMPAAPTPMWAYLLDHAAQQGAIVHHAPARLNNNQNGLRALEIGLATGADWILHLEDDIRGCRELGRSITDWLDAHLPEAAEAPFCTFHTPYQQVAKAHAAGNTRWAYPVHAFYGNQAWVMSRGMAQSAVAFLRGRIPLWRSSQGFDILLQRWMTEELKATHLVASAPSFVQHIGEESSLNNRFHQNQSWPGPDWTYTKKGTPR